MELRRKAPGLWVCAGLCLAAAGALPVGAACAPGQPTRPDAPKPHIEPRELADHFPDKPSIAPFASIPVDALGFAAPGPLYLGERNSLASLDFIGEDELLFTFRVPALLHRTPGDNGDSDEREIRAVVLKIPGGAVDAETNWLLHDRARYLWMLGNGHFLLRDRNSLVEGDASLKLKPLLRFPGPLLSVELDPTQTVLVTSSREPVKAAGAIPATDSGGSANGNDSSSQNVPDLVLRILDRASGQVMLVTRVRDLLHLPINTEGYLQTLRGNGVDWSVVMNDFTGGSHPVGTVKSGCMPDLNFISEREVLATACADNGEDALVAMDMAGEKLWIDLLSDRDVWPIVTMAPNGQRIARETLYVTHSVNAFAPLGYDDIKAQLLRVFDAATGQVAFESPVSPILDAGGNVAISPSGRRVALLNGGSIQVFELPTAPALPNPEHSSH